MKLTLPRVSSEEFVVAMGLLSFFRPTIFEKFALTNSLFNMLLFLAVVASGFIYYLVKRASVSLYVFLTLIFYALYAVSYAINQADLSRTFMFVLTGLGMVIFSEYILKHHLFFSLRFIKGMLWTFVALNLLSMLLFPEGIVATGNSRAPVYFLGQTTRFSYFYLPGLCLALLYDMMHHQRIQRNTILLYVIIEVNLLLSWSLGSLLAMLIFLPFFFLGNSFMVRRLFSPVLFLVVNVSAWVLLTFYSIQDLFAAFLEAYLRKDATLSSRTRIWTVAKRLIGENKALGIGILSNEEISSLFGFVHTHNHLLQVTLQVGYVGVVLFLGILYYAYRQLKKHWSHRAARLLGFSIFAFSILLLVDTIDGVRNYYLFLITFGVHIGAVIRQQKSEGA